MKLFIISALLALSGAAHATHCTNGLPDSAWPACIPPVTTPAPSSNTSSSDSHAQAAAVAAALAASRSTSDATAGVVGSGNSRQQQRQQQQQAQQQAVKVGNTNNVAASAAGAGASAGAGAGAGAGSGNSTGQTMYAGGAAGSGDNYIALALPSVPMTPPSMVAGAIVSTTTSACGPLQRITAESIYGENDGIFTTHKVWLGNTEKTADYLDEKGEWQIYLPRSGRWYGHQVIYSTAALSVSSASNLSIGGGSGGKWIDGGGGASGAMQRMVTTIQLRLCDAGPVVEPTVNVVVPPAPVVRKPVHRRAKPTCTPVSTLPACPIKK